MVYNTHVKYIWILKIAKDNEDLLLIVQSIVFIFVTAIYVL